MQFFFCFFCESQLSVLFVVLQTFVRGQIWTAGRSVRPTPFCCRMLKLGFIFALLFQKDQLRLVLEAVVDVTLKSKL